MSLLMVRKSAQAHAADANIDDIAYKYKVGDKIKTPDGVGTVQKKTHTNSGTPAYEVKLDNGGIVVHVEQSVSAAHDSAADATDAPINDVKMAIASTGAKVISVRSDQPNWFTFTIEGKSVRSVSQIIDKVSRVARVRKNSPEMWNPVTDPKNFKLQLAFDAADADKSEELEREIKGDVVAVVSGNAARVSKDVSFSTAKEGVESFARKNGVSVVASQEYGEAYKFKFSAAIDSAAQDRGNYATNTIALLKMAIGNLRTADSVVRRVVSNIGDAMDKVKDERAKSSLKSMQQEWWACEREMWAALEKVERISVPSGVGVPNKAKLSPEDRKFIDEFFE